MTTMTTSNKDSNNEAVVTGAGSSLYSRNSLYNNNNNDDINDYDSIQKLLPSQQRKQHLSLDSLVTLSKTYTIQPIMVVLQTFRRWV